MTDSDDKYDLNEEDKEVWDAYIGEQEDDTQEESFENLLEKENIKEEEVDSPLLSKKSEKPIEKKLSIKNKEVLPPQLDRRTEERLRKGKMSIEARIDLHGMTRTEAHERLTLFVKKCYRGNIRNLLVITGKGKSKSTSDDWLTPSKGVLKENVPVWLSTGLMKNYVLKFFPAQSKDGGSGALYVYLKRKR